jgi:UDP-3-O-[3-hydroxymyristoyl] N-acetylglucosamine deacetylase
VNDCAARLPAMGPSGSIPGFHVQREAFGLSMLRQRTLGTAVSCTGIGLHSGDKVTVTLRPAHPDHGIVFYRTDLASSPPIPARIDRVVDSRRATTLGVDDVRIATVEHLLAALCGMGVDNVRVEVDGPEIPILDGSAAPFVYVLRTAGIVSQKPSKRFLLVRRPVEVRSNGQWARIAPARRLSIACTIDFDHPLIQRQTYRMDFSDSAFAQDVARARTFGFMEEVERMRRENLALGGTLGNAVVVDDFHILNPDGLRFPDEFVRHKVLDALGDLMLVGIPIVGQFESYKGGHATNHDLLRVLLGTSRAAEVVEVQSRRDLREVEDSLRGWGTQPEAATA